MRDSTLTTTGLMRAAMTTNYGAPDVVTAIAVARPTVGDHDVLVEVVASTVTQGDRRLRAADFPGMSRLPGRLMIGVLRPRHAVQGTMFAGRVAAVGAAVTRFTVGDDVFGSAPHGAHAEYLALSDDGALARMPKNLSHAEAAALPYGAGTALVFLRDLANVSPGERVLILGASGGVGRFAVSLARHLGAEVTGVCSRDQDLVRSLGAHHVIDYTQEDFTQNGKRYDVIFDTSSVASQFRRCRPSLTLKGRYLSLHISLRLLFEMATTAVTKGPRAIFGVAMGDRAITETLSELAEQGVFRPVIARRFPLTHIADAYTHLESARPHGAVIIDVAPAHSTRAPQPAPALRVA